MPYISSAGARIYWEQHGDGDPILLIMGLSFTLDMWHRTAPLLERRYRTILFDNRGVGRSDVPPGPYRIPVMARDALAVLDAAGAGRAHVIGASMGGMIAQELALRWPERVRSLVLACTTCGGIHGHWPGSADLLRVLRASGRSPESRVRAFLPLLYAPGTAPELIEEDTAIRLRAVPSVRGYLHQLTGLLLWSSYRRLPRIQAPTLIVHGERDLILPAGNAATLARRIPNARKFLVPGAGHLFTTDAPGKAHSILFDFLDAVEARTSAAPESGTRDGYSS